MRLSIAILLVVIAETTFSQTPLKSESPHEPHWQSVDQLCGQIELSAPTKKTIVCDNKTETRLYATYLRDADVFLYSATAGEGTCCGSAGPIARTRSRQSGAFEFSQFRGGLYWLQVRKGTLEKTIPVRVIRDFDAGLCHDSSVRRSFVVDSRPPTVRTRIR